MQVHGYNQYGAIRITVDECEAVVPDDMENRYRQMIAEWEAEGNEIPPYVPPEIEPVTSYQLFKSTFISRMTDLEAASMETVLAGAPAKMRLMFNSVEYFVSDDLLFDDLKTAVSEALGPVRAMELLSE